MDNCTCPKPSALTEIPTQDCGVDLKQIQRLAFQRPGSFFDKTATPSVDIQELSSWQAYMSASDDTKLIVSPIVGSDPIIESGEAITVGGGDNTTLNGAEIITGTNPSTFSSKFNSLSPEIEKAFKRIMCERNLVVFMFLQGNKLACKSITPDKSTGFDIQAPFISDRNNAGFGSLDTHSFRFSLKSGWSEDLVVFDLNFNHLTDL